MTFLQDLPYVFIQYPAPDRGLCNIHQLVATAFRWTDAAKFLTGASAVGSMAIPIILRHAGMIGTGAMIIEFTSFFIFVCTVLCFRRASLLDEWQLIIPMK
ncbi:vacuolar protein sorting-associated protein 55 homolog [Primulina tabacum]|uniref:vacuolar protein sorting-associated protein 55 homolog n=1 Tax=Primulina tabacum TaxID=48773 RepID=UPI003F5989B6